MQRFTLPPLLSVTMFGNGEADRCRSSGVGRTFPLTLLLRRLQQGFLYLAPRKFARSTRGHHGDRSASTDRNPDSPRRFTCPETAPETHPMHRSHLFLLNLIGETVSAQRAPGASRGDASRAQTAVSTKCPQFTAPLRRSLPRSMPLHLRQVRKQ